MQRVLFSTLYPSCPGLRREDENTILLVEQYLRDYADVYTLSVFAGSAHKAAAEHMRRRLRGYGVESSICVIPYEHDSRFGARREHEIAFCKQWLALQWQELPFDVLVFLDSDILISFDDVHGCITALEKPLDFVRIPYVLRDRLQCPAIQFGAFVHGKELLDRIPYGDTLYRTHEIDGRIDRDGAPDCWIRLHLDAKGARCVNPPRLLETRHFTSADTYGLYRHGRASRHRAMGQVLGFDPEDHGLAMHPEALLALSRYCSRQRIASAIDLGTGSGNTLLTLAHSGVSDILSVDQYEGYTNLGKSLADDLDTGGRIEFLTLPVTRNDGAVQGRPYDLASIPRRRWDLVVVDGPAGDPWAPVLSAMQLDSCRYFIHDAHREEEQIHWFAGQLRRKNERVTCEFVDAGCGIAILERGPCPR